MAQEKHVVYVVDDERLISDTVALILNKAGFAATAFHDPQEALAAVQKRQPSLMLSDVRMPGMSGVQLAMLVRELCPECKILLFSGHATSFDLLEDARFRGQTFELLTKPVPPAQLIAKLRELAG